MPSSFIFASSDRHRSKQLTTFNSSFDHPKRMTKYFQKLSLEIYLLYVEDLFTGRIKRNNYSLKLHSEQNTRLSALWVTAANGMFAATAVVRY